MSSTQKKTPQKKESILELTKMIDSKVRVKCIGGRELVGTLRGYDELVNLVLDDADEFLRGEMHALLDGSIEMILFLIHPSDFNFYK